jgi:hypothetical protein
MATQDLPWTMDSTKVKSDGSDVVRILLYLSPTDTATLVIYCDFSKVDNVETQHAAVHVLLCDANGVEKSRILLPFQQPITVAAYQVWVATGHAKAIVKGSYKVL